MEDSRIIELFFARDERAISAATEKYGGFCNTVAKKILQSPEDAEECVNDAYRMLWQSVPPSRPNSLKAYLGRIVRNAALNIYSRNRAKRRYSGMETMLSELEDCLPSANTVEQETDSAEVGKVISGWLYSIPENDRRAFVRRYWYGESLSVIAAAQRTTPEKLAQKMYFLRRSLKKALEKEEIYL